MNSSTIRQSHKHPTLCTIAVDGYVSHIGDAQSANSQLDHHWRLPNTDPRNEGKYLFKLHTLDIYFWKPEDAHTFIAVARGKLQPNQVEVVDVPATPAAHQKAMSSVVQQLENIAIQDPAYGNGQTRNSRTISSSEKTSVAAATKSQVVNQETPQVEDSASFQPLAYNPAAPAAPEPIKHREKTPPPMDSEEGTGLASAAYRDQHSVSSPDGLPRPTFGQLHQSQGYVNPQSHQSYTPSFTTHSPAHPNSISPANALRASSVSSFPPPPPSQGGATSNSPYTPAPSFAPPPQHPQSTTPQMSQQLVPAPPPDHAPFYNNDNEPAESPATEILGSSYVSGVRQPLQHLQPQYANFMPTPSKTHEPEPLGGYSDYQYNQQHPHHHQQHQSPGKEYDIHSQVYRPTPEEAAKKKSSKASTAASDTASGRLEQGAGKVDKKVNSFFKKLEKKIG